jgi:hypothetical protein
MRKLDKKLHLHRETLLHLERRNLATVQGGFLPWDSTPRERTCSCESLCQCPS